MNLRTILVSGFLLTASSAFGSIVFDLETISATGVSNGALTSVSQTVGGLTLTITRESGGHFDIADLSAATGTPASWGTRSLSPFFDTTNTAFLGNFSATVNSVSLELGDYVPSDVDNLRLEAYSGANGTGSLLASIVFGPCCSGGTGFEGHTISLATAGIQSIRFIGGSTDFPNSTVYDNITVNPETPATPEPGTVGLIGLGLAIGAVKLRLRKK